MTGGKLPLLIAIGVVVLASVVEAIPNNQDAIETNSLESRKNSRSSSSSPAAINSLSSSGPSVQTQDALQPIYLQQGPPPHPQQQQQVPQGQYIIPLPANAPNSPPGASAPYYIPQYGVQYVQFIPRPVVMSNYPTYQQPQHYSTLPLVSQVHQSLHHHQAQIPQAAQYILPPPPGHQTISQQQQQQQHQHFLQPTLASYPTQTSAAGSGAVQNTQAQQTQLHHHHQHHPNQHIHHQATYLTYNPNHYSQPLPNHPHHHQQQTVQQTHQSQQQQSPSQAQLQPQSSNLVQTQVQPPAQVQQQQQSSYSNQSPVLSSFYVPPPQQQQRSVYSQQVPTHHDTFLNTNEYVPVDNSGFRAIKRSL